VGRGGSTEKGEGLINFLPLKRGLIRGRGLI